MAHNSEEASIEAMLDTLVGAVADQGEQMIKAVALAARRPVEWVGELNVDELVVLASMAVRVNMDFFGRALPGMQSIAAQLNPAAMADR